MSRDDATALRDGGGEEIRLLDEILEMLYWLEGEGIGEEAATFAGTVRFLARPADDIRSALDRLVARGDVVLAAGCYALTEPGRREAGRRFAEEFAPLLSQGHGECNDPDCDCHTSPGGAADCRVHRTRGH